LDAIAELNASESCFTAAEHRWVQDHAATSLAEIEKATLRIVARRMTSGVTNAAQRLGMASVSLSRWFTRRSAELPHALGDDRTLAPNEALRAIATTTGSSDCRAAPRVRARSREPCAGELSFAPACETTGDALAARATPPGAGSEQG